MFGYFRDFAHNPFLLTGLLAGLLAAVACGAVGPYVLSRRVVLLSGAIAHAAVGGVGIAIFFNWYFPGFFGWLDPTIGAAFVAVACAIVIAVGEQRLGGMPETLIGAMWAFGMSLGVLLAKMTPGYQVQLMNFLFGNISYVSWPQVQMLLVLDGIILSVVLLFHKQLMAFCLDPEQAQLQGVSPTCLSMILLGLTALAVVALAQVVGLVMVITLLALPAATVAPLLNRFGPLVFCTTILAAILTTLPRIFVYGTFLSAESSIVIAAVVCYLGVLTGRLFYFKVISRQRSTSNRTSSV
jgi:zinc transport system permease protein